MAIICTLAGLLFPVLVSGPIAARKAVARAAGVNLVIALEQFKNEYGVYPDLGTSNADTFVAADNHRLLDILRGKETGPNVQNPRKISFFTYKNAKDSWSTKRDGFDSDGNLMDPWGHQYKIKYDTNYDNRLMAYGEDLDLGAIAWSVGHDGVEVVNYTQFSKGDDVVTWR